MGLSEGTKYDEGKDPVDLLSPFFLSGISQVLKFGAEKYEPYNWAKGIKYSRVYSALQRHLWAFWAGEELDEETGKPHLWHAGCCLMFLTHYNIHTDLYKEYDDRPNYETVATSGDSKKELSESRGLSGEDSQPTVLLESQRPADIRVKQEWPGEDSLAGKHDH